MSVLSSEEMFEMVSRHFGNRESVDATVHRLLQAQSASDNEDLADALAELNELAVSYALCSQMILESSHAIAPDVAAQHQQAFMDNIGGISYLHGIAEAMSNPGVVSPQAAQRIQSVLSSKIAQCLYEHFDMEKSLCQTLWPLGPKSVDQSQRGEQDHPHLFDSMNKILHSQPNVKRNSGPSNSLGG